PPGRQGGGLRWGPPRLRIRPPHGAGARRILERTGRESIPHREVSGSPGHPARGRTPDGRAAALVRRRFAVGPGLPGDGSLSVAADRRGAPDPGPIARADEAPAPEGRRAGERLPA